MIFPLLGGFLWLHRIPVVWAMLILNISFFAWTYPTYQLAEQLSEELLSDDQFQEQTAKAFASLIRNQPATQLLLNRSKPWAPGLSRLAERTLEGEARATRLLAGFAIREPGLLNALLSYSTERIKPSERRLASVSDQSRLKIDAIELEPWVDQVTQLQNIQSIHPSYRFGLMSGHEEWTRWLTYQISHSGWIHLFWNMLFLTLFGGFIELARGRLAFLVILWGSGIAGAIAYSTVSGLTASPLVGASGAVSGLIASVIVFWNRKLPFMYWLLPLKGYYGVKMLPAWILIPAFIFPDLTGHFSSPGLSGVAYAAHLGGAFMGAVLTLFFRARPEFWTELNQSFTFQLARKWR